MEETKGTELFLKLQKEFSEQTITTGLKILTQSEQKALFLSNELSTQAPQIEQRLGQYSLLQRHKGAIEADGDLNQYYQTTKSQLQQNFIVTMSLNTGEIQLNADMVDIAIQMCAVASGKYIPIAGILVDIAEKTSTAIHALERYRYINHLHQLIPTLEKIEIYSECLAIESAFYKRKQIKEAAVIQDESLSGQLSDFFQNAFKGEAERKYLFYKLRTGHDPSSVEKMAIINSYQLLFIMMNGEIKPGQGDKPIMTQILKKLLGDEYQNTALMTIAKPSEKNDNATLDNSVSREEFEALKKQLQEKNNHSKQSQIETVVDNRNGSVSVMFNTQAIISTPMGDMPISDAIRWLMQQQANHDAYIHQSTHVLAHYAEQQGIIIQNSDKERKITSQEKEQLLGQSVQQTDSAQSLNM